MTSQPDHLLIALGRLNSIVSSTVKNNETCTINVCGCIGAGKTTIIDSLLVPFFKYRGFSVSVVREPIEEWGDMLEKFYQDQSRWAYTFQTLTLTSRVKAWNNRTKAQVVIVERGIESDNIFARMLADEGTMSAAEYSCYKDWWGMWTKVADYNPDVYVNTVSGLGVMMDRVKNRSRPGEELVSEDYQSKLAKYHTQFMVEKDNVVILNTENVDEPTYREYTTKSLPSVITIDGPIAAGKTTKIPEFVEQITSKRIRVGIVQENINAWKPQLERFYTTGEGGFELQKAIVLTRARDFAEAYCSGHEVIVQERSIASDFIFASMLHDSGKISDSEFEQYRKIHHWLMSEFYVPGTDIYMKISPQTCLERIAKRGRPTEENITIEYLVDLCERYNNHYKPAN